MISNAHITRKISIICKIKKNEEPYTLRSDCTDRSQDGHSVLNSNRSRKGRLGMLKKFNNT